MSAPTTTSSLTMQDFFSSTLSSSIIASDTVISLNAVPSGTEGFLVIDQDNASKEIIYYNSKGASSVTCPNAATGRGQGGTTAVSHSSGATVKLNVVSQYWTELQNGDALAQNAIAAKHLATNAITLGYAQIVSTFTTATSGSYVDVTSLTTTVTVPAGGRRIRIQGFADGVGSTETAGNGVYLNICEDGTQIGQLTLSNVGNSPYHMAANVFASKVPAAGSHTYKIQAKQDTAGTLSVFAGSTAPAFILVTVI